MKILVTNFFLDRIKNINETSRMRLLYFVETTSLANYRPVSRVSIIIIWKVSVV